MIEDIKPIIGVFLKTQSLIHSIDELSDSSTFKREFKQRTNNYLSFIDKNINIMLKTTSIGERDQYSQIVNELDSIIDKMNITLK